MKIFRRFFERKSKPGEPENSKLLQLLDIYWKADGEGNSYKNVVLELMNGNAFLILPGHNEFGRRSAGWVTTKEAMTMNLSSLYTLDGLKVLAAFTDEKALLDWAKKPCAHSSMRAKDVLKLCEANGIARIVINNNSPNMFVLERVRGDMQEYMIPANSEVQIGIPRTPIDRHLLDKMIAGFKGLNNVKRVYHYGQTKSKEFSLVLGVELEKTSDNGKKAVIDVVREAIGNEKLPNPLDVFFIETEESRMPIAAIEGSLIYGG